MSPVSIYSAKAELYARYRWDYDPGAVELVFNRTRIDSRSTVIELGAGTGILTRHFTGRVRRMVAIEPDLAMNRWIKASLPTGRAVSVVAATAEAVPLPSHSAEAILAAQAIHWFDPLPTRQEIQRLLKNHGWLVLIRNYGTDKALGNALNAIHIPENGVEEHSRLSSFPPKPAEYYYGHASYLRKAFPFSTRQDWTTFLGSLLSASFTPEESHPLFKRYCREARQVFNRFAVDGWLESWGETEVIIGQVQT